MMRLREEYPQLREGVQNVPRTQERLGALRAALDVWHHPQDGLTRRPPILGTGYAGRELGTLPPGTSINSGGESVGLERGGKQFRLTPAGALIREDDMRFRKSAVRYFNGGNEQRGAAYDSAAVVGDLAIFKAIPVGEDHRPRYNIARPFAALDNQRKFAVWIRGGAYGRPFRVSFTKGNSRAFVQYVTRSAAYPGKLETSDLNTQDPEYSKKVNDRTNIYNAAVTAWTSAALRDATPENIAKALAQSILDSRLLNTSAQVTVEGAVIYINDTDIEDISGSDGGDGSLIRAVGNTVESPELLSQWHIPGKIVKMLPNDSAGAVPTFLKAVAREATTGLLAKVAWEEAAGEAWTWATCPLYFGTVKDPATADPVFVQAYHQDIPYLNAAAGSAFPSPTGNVSGDLETNPPPAWFQEGVRHVVHFQDRLLVVTDKGTVCCSQIGNYLDFSKVSVLASTPADAFEFSVLGSDGDPIEYTLEYDRGLLLVGKLRQYFVDGRSALAPGVTQAKVFSTVPNMGPVPPVVVGDSIVFLRQSGGEVTLHSLRPGGIVESPTTVDLSAGVGLRPSGLEALVPTGLTAVPDKRGVILHLGTRQGGAPATAPHLWWVDLSQERPAFWPWSTPVGASAVGLLPCRGILNVGGVVWFLADAWVCPMELVQPDVPDATNYPADMDGSRPAAFVKLVPPNSYVDRGYTIGLRDTETGANPEPGAAVLQALRLRIKGGWEALGYKPAVPLLTGQRTAGVRVVPTASAVAAPAFASYQFTVPYGEVISAGTNITIAAAGAGPFNVHSVGWDGALLTGQRTQ